MTTTKRGKKPQTRRSLILRVCIFAFVLYSAIKLVDMQVQLAEHKREAELLVQQMEVQRIANKDLERQLADGVDDEYIERVARDQLDYVYSDERVYIDISGS